MCLSVQKYANYQPPQNVFSIHYKNDFQTHQHIVENHCEERVQRAAVAPVRRLQQLHFPTEKRFPRWPRRRARRLVAHGHHVVPLVPIVCKGSTQPLQGD